MHTIRRRTIATVEQYTLETTTLTFYEQLEVAADGIVDFKLNQEHARDCLESRWRLSLLGTVTTASTITSATTVRSH
jgi:hypothetical protein